MPPRVFVTRQIATAALDRIAQVCQIDLWPDELPPPPAALAEHARGAAGLLSMVTDRVDAALLDAAGPALRVVSNMAVGVNNIDVAAAHARGIAVGNTPGVLTDATADLALALLLAWSRRLVEGAAYIKAGEWRTWHPQQLLGRELAGAVLGIIGYGRIGQAVARRARAFGMRVLAYSPSLTDEAAAAGGVQRAGFDDVLREAEFVSLHTPYSPQTHHLIGAPQLALMRPDAVLINTARGPVVDQAALLAALTAGRIAGAALDVTDPEPMAADDPLLRLSNVLVVPHIGSATRSTRERMALMAAENLIAGVTGTPLPNPV